MRTIAASVILLGLAGPPAMAQGNVQQMLGGLLTGNQNQDQALRDAYERGYQRGRQDEARLTRDRPRSDRYEDRGYDDRGQQPYRR